MKISVIVPTYKPQRYIFECLESLRKQSMNAEDFEVIIVLNGCCEPYNKMIERWIATHNLNHFILIQTDIGGVSNARNIGLDEARGEYVTFIDDDDFVSSAYLEELYSKATPEIISLCYPLSFVDGSDNYLPYYITKDYYKYVNNGPIVFTKPRRFFAGPVYKLIHKSIIGNRRFDVRFKNGEDSLFMFLISDKMRFVDFTSKLAIYYRRERDNSASSKGKKLAYTFSNRILLIKEYSRIYFAEVKSYRFSFYLSMIWSSIKKILYEMLVSFNMSFKIV